MSSGGTSILCLGPQPNRDIFYSAKMFSVSRLKIKPGPYESGAPPLCTIESKHTFSNKTTISFTDNGGYESFIKETSEFHEGAKWPFQVNVGGTMQEWAWRRRKSHAAIKQIVGAPSQVKLGSWELVLKLDDGSFCTPMATFEPAGGNTLEKNSELRVFEFHSHALTGGMGDLWTNVVIAVFLRIVSQHYISMLARLAV